MGSNGEMFTVSWKLVNWFKSLEWGWTHECTCTTTCASMYTHAYRAKESAWWLPSFLSRKGIQQTRHIFTERQKLIRKTYNKKKMRILHTLCRMLLNLKKCYKIYSTIRYSMVWYRLHGHEPWCSGFWPSVITHFNTTLLTFCDWFQQMGMRPCGSKCPPPPQHSSYYTGQSSSVFSVSAL